MGILAAGLLFLLIPMTQMFTRNERTVNAIEESNLSAPPPPPPPSESPPPPPRAEETPPPELKLEPPLPNLEQLELSLNPGIGGEITIGVGLDLDLKTESAEQMMEIFGFDELDEVPHLTRGLRINYPPQLQRSGISGYVQLLVLIDESGRVEVDKVLSYSHAQFIEAAKRGVESARFSVPTRQGQAVRASYSWKIEFNIER